MTNTTILVDTLSKAVQSGLISEKKAHHAFNYDDDEEQNEEDYKLVLEERDAQTQRENYGGMEFNDKNYFGDEEVTECENSTGAI